MKDKLNAYYLFWIFLIGSVFGWTIEVIFTLIKNHEFINHSALVIGPFNVIYGFGACILTALLYRYQQKPNWQIFLISFVSGSLLEYICSWGMEFVLGFTAWDYSNNFLNINGRICLSYSIMWGLLGIIYIKFIYNWLIKFIDLWSYNRGKKISLVLLIFMAFDITLTTSAVVRAKNKDRNIPPANIYENLLDHTFNEEYLKNMFSNSWS